MALTGTEETRRVIVELPEPVYRQLGQLADDSQQSLEALTTTGRATAVALRLNNEYVVEARTLWIAREWHPPSD